MNSRSNPERAFRIALYLYTALHFSSYTFHCVKCSEVKFFAKSYKKKKGNTLHNLYYARYLTTEHGVVAKACGKIRTLIKFDKTLYSCLLQQRRQTNSKTLWKFVADGGEYLGEVEIGWTKRFTQKPTK